MQFQRMMALDLGYRIAVSLTAVKPSCFRPRLSVSEGRLERVVAVVEINGRFLLWLLRWLLLLWLCIRLHWLALWPRLCLWTINLANVANRNRRRYLSGLKRRNACDVREELTGLARVWLLSQKQFVRAANQKTREFFRARNERRHRVENLSQQLRQPRPFALNR